MYTPKHISQIINASIKGNFNGDITHLLIDSRELVEPKKTLFVALVSSRNDGHKYIDDLYKKGVRVFVVSQLPKNYMTDLIDACFLVVDNTLIALQQLTAYHRQQYTIPIIGITGSNGKTIVKEWLYQLLKNDYNICRSPKSYNSQIGVPMSVWQLNNAHTLGIFEAGISEPNEMVVLEVIIKPTVGIITSLGDAHSEGFTDAKQKLNEKLLLFKNCATRIVNALDFNDELLNELPKENLFLISKSDKATLQIINTESQNTTSIITAKYKNETLYVSIPFTDKASINNAITCWATLLFFNVNEDEIQTRLNMLQPVEMRLELKQAIHNSILINDFYNSDLTSLEIAMHYQIQQQRGGKKVLILSDIEQSGKPIEELYNEVSVLLQRFKVDVLVGIGSEIKSQKDKFKIEGYFYQNTSEFLNAVKTHQFSFNNSVILLKGARSFGFEIISKQLQQKSHDTVLEINLNHLVHNLNFYRSQIQADTFMMCMVKATGYGAGSSEIAFTLQHHNVNYLAVAYTDEGVELRKAGIHLPIMVMSPEESSYDDMIDYKLEPEIYSFKIAQEFIATLQNKAITEPYPVHLKIDTGMHRLGFEEHEVSDLIQLLQKEKTLKVKSIFSHLVASDNAAFDDFTNTQIKLFTNITFQIENALGYETLKHICNSGAITRFKNAHFNMVRLGIGLYGVGFNSLEKQHLKNISSLKTRISQIKHLKKDDTVGYNRNALITRDTTIATIPIGYADGFNRKLGTGNHYVMINNISCKTIGNICMDMCMVDVTHVNCKEGDEVIVFETNEQLNQLSIAMETIPYEVLTSISSRVKRIYVQE